MSHRDLHSFLSAACFPLLYGHTQIPPLMPHCSVAICLSLSPSGFLKDESTATASGILAPFIFQVTPILTSPFSMTTKAALHGHFWLNLSAEFGITDHSLLEFSSVLIYPSVFFPSYVSSPSFFLSFYGLFLFLFLSLKVGVSEGSVLSPLICHLLAVTHLLLPFLPNFLKSCIQPLSPSLQHPFNPSTECNLGSVLQLHQNCSKIHPLFWNPTDFSPYFT